MDYLSPARNGTLWGSRKDRWCAAAQRSWTEVRGGGDAPPLSSPPPFSFTRLRLTLCGPGIRRAQVRHQGSVRGAMLSTVVEYFKTAATTDQWDDE